MKQTKQFLRPLLMAIVMLVGMLMPQGAWAQSSPVTVGGQGFQTIQDAIDHIVYGAKFDATLTLHQDFTLEDGESININFESGSEYFNITIDLNGHTITGGCDWDNNSIGFSNNGWGLPTVTIDNSCQDKKGKLFNCRLDINPNIKVIVNEGVSIYPSFELFNSAPYVVNINSETSSVENYGDIYGVRIMSGGSFINNGRVAYVNGEFVNNGSYCAYFNWADDGSSFSAYVYDGTIYDYNEGDEDTSITSEVTKEPTCTEPGVRTFTGTVFYGGQEFTDTKEVEIPAGHNYQVLLDENNNPVFVWSEDYTSATLQVVCSHNAEHTANVEVTGEGITSEDTTPATCTAAGVRTYTAKATYESVEYTGTKEVEIPAGHSFVDGVCEVCHGTAVAEVKIGETTTGYTDIQEAFDAAMAVTGDVTVKLLADVTLIGLENNLARDYDNDSKDDVILTLDLNGHSATGNSNLAGIPVTSITLKITDSSNDMTGSINNCLLLVVKSDIYVDQDVTLRAEQWDWDLVDLQGDCLLENRGNLYGNVVYCRETAFYNYGSVVSAQNRGGDFYNEGSFIPIWDWVYNDVYEVMSFVSVSVNGTIYSSDEGAFEVSSEVTQAPTCTEKGERTYTANLVIYDEWDETIYTEYTDTYSVYIDIDPNAHSFTSQTLTAEPDEHGLYAYVCDREGCEGHGDYNVVKASAAGEGESATTIELTANNDGGETTYSASAPVAVPDGAFSTPVDFTATGAQVSIDRTFTTGTPATINLPFDVPASAMSETYYTFGGIAYNSETGKWVATMTEATGTLTANTPYIVLPANANITIGSSATVSFKADASANNTTTSGDWTMKAAKTAKTWAAGDEELGKAYGFAAQAQAEGNITAGQFVKVGADASIAAGRAYLKFTGETFPSAAPTRATAQLPTSIDVIFKNAETTGIGTLNTETGKFTFDGWYDLQGRPVSNPQKGNVLMNNNQKIIVK